MPHVITGDALATRMDALAGVGVGPEGVHRLAWTEEDARWRSKTSPSSAKLPRSNPTKQRVLELLAQFFCLRTNDAAELLRNRAITDSDLRSVRRRE